MEVECGQAGCTLMWKGPGMPSLYCCENSLAASCQGPVATLPLTAAEPFNPQPLKYSCNLLCYSAERSVLCIQHAGGPRLKVRSST